MKEIKQIFLLIIVIVILFNIFAAFHAYRFTHPVKERIYEYKGYEGFLQKIKVTLFGIPPLRSRMNLTPSDFNLSYFNITFITVDGVKLHSWLIRANNSKGIILLVHGYGGNKASLLSYASILNKNNFDTLLLDLRASGLSEGSATSLGYYEKNDIKIAMNYLKNNGYEKIGALGFSMGGVAILSYLQENKSDIDALIIAGVYDNIYNAVGRRIKIIYGLPKFPFATALTFYGGLLFKFNAFKLAPEKFVSEINIPILIMDEVNYNLIIISEIKAPFLIDEEGKFHQKEDALKLYNNANFPKEIFIVENSTSSKTYSDKIVEFFDMYLT